MKHLKGWTLCRVKGHNWVSLTPTNIKAAAFMVCARCEKTGWRF